MKSTGSSVQGCARKLALSNALFTVDQHHLTLTRQHQLADLIKLIDLCFAPHKRVRRTLPKQRRRHIP